MWVASGDSEDPIEQRRVGGHGDLGAEQALDPSAPEVRDQGIDGIEAGAVILLARLAGLALARSHPWITSSSRATTPAMSPGSWTPPAAVRPVQAAGSSHASAERAETLGDARSPARLEMGGIAGWAAGQRILHGCGVERGSRAVQVVEQRGHRVGRAWRGLIERVVGQRLDDPGQSLGGRVEVDGRAHATSLPDRRPISGAGCPLHRSGTAAHGANRGAWTDGSRLASMER